MAVDESNAILELMEQECDRLRKQLEDKAAENAALRRQIERFQIHASLLGVDTIAKYDHAMEQLQTQRDQALSEIDSLREAVDTYYTLAQEGFQKTRQGAEQEAEGVKELIDSDNAPQVVYLLLSAFDHVENIAIERYEKTAGAEIEKRGRPITAAHDPRLIMSLIGQFNYLAGIWAVAFRYVIAAYGLANGPAVVADEILRECRNMASLI